MCRTRTKMHDDHYEQQTYVSAHGEWVNVKEVEFLDISEDIHGRDLMTFRYKGEEFVSNVVVR